MKNIDPYRIYAARFSRKGHDVHLMSELFDVNRKTIKKYMTCFTNDTKLDEYYVGGIFDYEKYFSNNAHPKFLKKNEIKILEILPKEMKLINPIFFIWVSILAGAKHAVYQISNENFIDFVQKGYDYSISQIITLSKLKYFLKIGDKSKYDKEYDFLNIPFEFPMGKIWKYKDSSHETNEIKVFEENFYNFILLYFDMLIISPPIKKILGYSYLIYFLDLKIAKKESARKIFFDEYKEAAFASEAFENMYNNRHTLENFYNFLAGINGFDKTEGIKKICDNIKGVKNVSSKSLDKFADYYFTASKNKNYETDKRHLRLLFFLACIVDHNIDQDENSLNETLINWKKYQKWLCYEIYNCALPNVPREHNR